MGIAMSPTLRPRWTPRLPGSSATGQSFLYKIEPLFRFLMPWKWTRTQRIRTAARVDLEATLVEPAPAPIYQQIAPKAEHLRELGLSDKAIARLLGVSDKTVAKATSWPPQSP